MSRARSWVSQVKPSPIALMVTRSGKRSSTMRSPVSQLPLTNCTTPACMPWPTQRSTMPKAAVDLPLPLPVWTMSRPFSMVLPAMHLVARRLLLAPSSRRGAALISSSVMPSVFIGRAPSSRRVELDGRRRCARGCHRPRSMRLLQPLGDLARARPDWLLGDEAAHRVVAEIGVEDQRRNGGRRRRRWWRRRRTGSRPSPPSRRRPCSRGASRRAIHFGLTTRARTTRAISSSRRADHAGVSGREWSLCQTAGRRAGQMLHRRREPALELVVVVAVEQVVLAVVLVVQHRLDLRQPRREQRRAPPRPSAPSP